MANKGIFSSLSEYGWKVRDDYISSLISKNNSLNLNDARRSLLNTDIKEYGLSSLQFDNQRSCHFNDLPLILQVTAVRNISAPKVNQESSSGPRLLKVTMTDGTSSIHGLEVEPISTLSIKIAPGTKIRLISKVEVIKGFAFLNPLNTEVLGGVVKDLYEKWSVSQSVSRFRQTASSLGDPSGPPPWVPFGQHLNYEMEKNFKAMDILNCGKERSTKEQRLPPRGNNTSELESEAPQKVFGGGRQMLDSNVQKIIDIGPFTIEDAEMALRKSRNNVQKAIEILKRDVLGVDTYSGRDNSGYTARGRRRGGRSKRGRGRDGPDGMDDDFSYSASRPSGPTSLFDYLDKKIHSRTS